VANKLKVARNMLASALACLTSLDNRRSELYCCDGEVSVDCRSVSSASYNHKETWLRFTKYQYSVTQKQIWCRC